MQAKACPFCGFYGGIVWVLMEHGFPKFINSLEENDNLYLVVDKWGNIYTSYLYQFEDDKPYWIQYGRDGYRIESKDILYWSELPQLPN